MLPRKLLGFGASLLIVLAVLTASCAASSSREAVTSFNISEATFEISDAAVASNCLNLGLAVRGFRPPDGEFPQRGFPPAKKIDIESPIPGLVVNPIPLGGGGGGGGQQDDGRLWMRQEVGYALAAPIKEGSAVPLDITVEFDEFFGLERPLEFHLDVVAGPAGGQCPYPALE